MKLTAEGEKGLSIPRMEKEPYKKLLKQSTLMDEKKGVVDDGGLEMEASTHKTWIPFDLLFHIFLLLPAESLCRVSFACKTLFNMITSSNFIEAHLRQSETILLTLKSVLEDNTSLPFARRPNARNRIFFFESWELHSGKRSKVCAPNLENIEGILASCNGLVLTKMRKNGGLVVINPSSRKHTQLPLGTIGFHPDSYGFMRRQWLGGYKVVHLFRDKFDHVRCEILNLATRSWHAVDGPSSAIESIIDHTPVSAIGAMYWLPERFGCNHIVSLGYDDEKFVAIPLPISSTKNDRLVEVGGLLSFVTHATMHLIQVWILRRDGVGENWIKRYSINRSYDITGLVPFCTSGCEMVFVRHRKHLLYVYNLETDEMKEVVLDTETMSGEHGQEYMEFDWAGVEENGDDFTFYIPHVNSLVSCSTPNL